MMLSELIDNIIVYKDCIDIIQKISMAEYCKDSNICDETTYIKLSMKCTKHLGYLNLCLESFEIEN